MAALEAVALIRHLSHAFPNATIPPETIEIYAGRLAWIPVNELAHVVDRAIGQCKFFPSLAELDEIYAGLRRTNICSSDRDAGEKLARHREFLSNPPREMLELIEGVSKKWTPDRKLLS